MTNLHIMVAANHKRRFHLHGEKIVVERDQIDAVFINIREVPVNLKLLQRQGQIYLRRKTSCI